MDILDEASYTAKISSLVLQNLNQLEDLDFAAEVAKEMTEATSCGQHKQVFEFCHEFAKTHKKYPDWPLLKSKFGDHVEEFSEDWSADHARELIFCLRRENCRAKAATLMSENKFDEASMVLSSMVSTKQQKRYSVRDSIDEYNKIKSQPGGLLTGVNEIDVDLKGMQLGTVTVFGAPKSMFKTAMMVNVLYNGAMFQNYNCVGITLEVKKEHLWFHLLSRHSTVRGNKITSESLIKGILKEEEERYFAEELVPDFEENCKAFLEIVDVADFEGGMTFSSITRKLMELDEEAVKKTGNGLDVAWLDYLQLMKFYRGRVDGDQFLNDVVRYFGNLSITFKGRGLIAVLNAQVNREGEKKIARFKKINERSADASMLAEVNELERTANAVIIQYSDKGMRLASQLMVQLVKNRNGKVQSVMSQVYVDPTCNQIGQMEISKVFSADSIDVLGYDASDDADIF